MIRSILFIVLVYFLMRTIFQEHGLVASFTKEFQVIKFISKFVQTPYMYTILFSKHRIC